MFHWVLKSLCFDCVSNYGTTSVQIIPTFHHILSPNLEEICAVDLKFRANIQFCLNRILMFFGITCIFYPVTFQKRTILLKISPKILPNVSNIISKTVDNCLISRNTALLQGSILSKNISSFFIFPIKLMEDKNKKREK